MSTEQEKAVKAADINVAGEENKATIASSIDNIANLSVAENAKGTVNRGEYRQVFSSPEREIVSPCNSKNSTTLPKLPLIASSRPTHSSGPSIVFSNKPKQISTITHNRNATPHTESLMNMFARPASSPMTPSVSEYGAVNTNINGFGESAPTPLLMPDFIKGLRESITPTTNNNFKAKVGKMKADDGPLFIPQPGIIDPAQNLKVEKPYHRQNTPKAHNRDETMVAHNTRRKNKPCDNDQQIMFGGVANVHEKTGLVKTHCESANNEDARNHTTDKMHLLLSNTKLCDPEHLKPTLVGAFLFSLYQLVFCFAEASAISRPSHSSSASSSLLSPMALMACMGSLITAPMLICVLGGDYPALYPCLDMFMAPFLAQMAVDIDEVLVQLQDDHDSGDDSGAFLATFVALNAFGTLFSGLLCVLAGKVKLANLAGFLPYPVLCGFFSSVGISVWMSAFKVDTGVTIQKAISSGSGMSLLMNFARHAPSFIAGAALYVLGPRGPHFLLGIIVSTITFAYLTMLLTHTSLEEAQDLSFFWKKEEVMMSTDGKDFSYGPPSAFGLWSPAVLRKICWPAFMNSLSGVIAMSVIYLLRCSLHAAALNKCAAKMKTNDATEVHPLSSTNGKQIIQSTNHGGCTENGTTHTMEQGHEKIHAKKSKPKDLMIWYANSLFAVAFSGGFAVLPAIALGGIFSKMGAQSRSPQYIAMILLLGCYLSDFRLVAYVPKCTFSSLLVLAAIDLIDSWFIKSYQKSATEWVVVPFIVITSLAYGMLQSVGLGLAVSTLIFVASFYRAGVVKFIANGLTIRSTIERNCEDNQWLDQHADLIQILVLQNYLFFGNANSCLKYIHSMFEDDEDGAFDADLPPIPKYVILDLSIVTGIDTSAVDVLADISSLCKEKKCNLILAGIPRVIRQALITGGVKASRTNKHLSFSPDLETALGKAEDELLRVVGHNEDRLTKVGDQLRHKRRVSMVDHGLRHALREIDAQQNLSMSKHLQTLEKYTTPIEVNAGDSLNDAGRENNLPRGLYFVEAGLLKCEHDSSASLTRGRRKSSLFAAPHLSSNADSIGQVQARSATVGRCANMLKKNPGAMMAQNHIFRLARIGPGWVIGSISDFMGQDIRGTYTALTPCRVHHLKFETIDELEVDEPALILHLYKLLSHLAARRQEMTIGQLSTLRSIMSATAPTKPISRSKMGTINQSF
mmetsp:Transcript_16617/g.35906  ORF Transcript_16617/g.35906 Transcript_16617/m.35906 type:complete len:1197 (-) Transcript_16617:138-3728(-)|eukprot:CAMPEP_0172298950 /NCGR_PEP_ID=MMETSP1058-20130122/1365_1 /TAXON_ID=83371 /ORGANISM="Detonula confervacea, Strain CCMP 353" /LENGTH=1196 /DNA_ID=CAMNT_0013008245 /DNA_START=188 /DNA_END=3778 /DNA_ORIENTATION=-